MARKDIINQDGTPNWDTVAGFVERLDGHDGSLAQRTQQIKSWKVDIVADYGADPTGTNNSDTAVSNALTAINSAINTLSSPPILYFPTGNYKFANPFPLIKNRIHLKGSGILTTTLNFNHTNGSHCITLGDNSKAMDWLYWEGFTINGNAQTGDGLHLVYVQDARFESLNITNCGGHGLYYEKGWEVRFKDIRCLFNAKHGFYCLATQAAYSELNDIVIEQGEYGHNGYTGICIGKLDNTYTAEEGYVVHVRNNYIGNNGWGNILVAGERNVLIEQNYMEDATTNPTGSASSDAYHVYIGQRTNSGLGTAHAVTIRDNHFNGMNDSHMTPPINNATGYAIIFDNVIGAVVENNFFYGSVTGTILAKSTAQKILIKPNIYYESGGIPYVVDQTNNQLVWVAQSGNQLQLTGLLTGSYFQQQGFENLIKNGNFELVDASNNPQGFFTQSLTFAKDTDGALICTGTNGGGYQQVRFDIGTRYSQFKGKYVIFCAEVKVMSGTTSNPNLRIQDGVSETDLPLSVDGNYHDVYVVRKIDANATYLRFNIGSSAGTGTTSDQFYIRNMRAYFGQTALGYQKAPTDHSPDIVTTLPTAGANYRGRTVMVQGNGTTTADIIYICVMSSTGTYSWKQLISG